MATDRQQESLTEQIVRLQREYNEWAQNATPEERAAATLAALRQMPGQAYLFEDDGPAQP